MISDLEDVERHRAVWEDLRRLYDLRSKAVKLRFVISVLPLIRVRV